MGAPIDGIGEPDEADPAELDPAELEPDELLGEGELDRTLDEPESPPPPRGTADPTVSPLEGREDSPCGRPRSCAQAEPTVSANAAAVSPTDSV
jgi:hypothetical protein